MIQLLAVQILCDSPQTLVDNINISLFFRGSLDTVTKLKYMCKDWTGNCKALENDRLVEVTKEFVCFI